MSKAVAEMVILIAKSRFLRYFLGFFSKKCVLNKKNTRKVWKFERKNLILQRTLV